MQLTIIALAAALALQEEPPRDERAAIDKPVRDFRLVDLMADTETHVTLSQFKDKKAVVLLFISYQCPVTWKYEKRFGKLLEDYKEKDVVFLGVRSNARDTADATRKYCEARNLDVPVLFDEGNVVADYFAIAYTPKFVVIDSKGVMRYSGVCDDNPDEKAVKKHYVRAALDAVLVGREVAEKKAEGSG